LKRLFGVVGVFSAYMLFISLYFPTRDLALFVWLMLLGIGALLYLIFFARGVFADPKHKRLLAEGKDAVAVVQGVADTGITLNNSLYVRLTLDVYPDGAQPFRAEVKVFVSRVAIPRVGDQLSVKYDPRRPQDLIVV
jgi:hypothetical protein